jgi:dTDP-4-dehydrorhamnose reductase
MKILVYGARGWIGNQFTDILDKNNINYVIGRVHIEQVDILKNEIKNVKPTQIISL